MMSRRFSILLTTTLLSLGTLALTACQRHAGSTPAAGASPSAPTAVAETGKLTVSAAYSRATPPGATVGVGYLTIVNGVAKGDVLMSASSPLAAQVSIHQTLIHDGMSEMRELEHGLPVPRLSQVQLAPGGAHLMLTGLKQPLAAGNQVPVTLKFLEAGEVSATLEVRPLDGAAPAPMPGMDSMEHRDHGDAMAPMDGMGHDDHAGH